MQPDKVFRTALDSNEASNLEGALGQLRFTDDGRIFKFIQASANIAAGQVVSSVEAYAENADVDAVSAIGSNTLTATGDFAGDSYGPGDYVFIDANTGIGQLREIDHVRDANTLVIKGTWSTALDATSDYLVLRPHYCGLAAAAGICNVVGIAQNAITQYYFGWVQIWGVGVALTNSGSTAILVVGEHFVVDDTDAGSISGYTAAGTTADEAGRTLGVALAVFGASDNLVPVMIMIH